MRRNEQKGREPQNGIPTFSAFVLPDTDIDETTDKYGVALHNCWDGEKQATPFRVRMTVEAEVRPMDLVRVDGRWCLSFVVIPPNDAHEWSFAVEVGDGGAFSFEEAVNRLVAG